MTHDKCLSLFAYPNRYADLKEKIAATQRYASEWPPTVDDVFLRDASWMSR
jgi:hypothetical protein